MLRKTTTTPNSDLSANSSTVNSADGLRLGGLTERAKVAESVFGTSEKFRASNLSGKFPLRFPEVATFDGH